MGLKCPFIETTSLDCFPAMKFNLYFYIPVLVSVSILLLCIYTLIGLLRIANYLPYSQGLHFWGIWAVS